MPAYRTMGLPKLTGNNDTDIVNLRNIFYEQDEQLRYLFNHLDEGNFGNDFPAIDQKFDGITLSLVNYDGTETSLKLTDGTLDLSFLKGEVDDAKKYATNFISMGSDGGVEVGNKSSGVWTGYRSQMLADSFNILNSAGSVLASYGAQDIYLGKNSTDSVIHFCGDKATISYNNGDLFFKGEGDGTSTVYLGMYKSGDYGPGLYMRSEYKTAASADWDYSEIVVEHPYIGIRAGQLIDLLADTVNVSGKIRGNSIGSYGYQGRKNALIATDNKPGNTTALCPIASMKTTSGDWSIGTIGEALNFVYTKDTDYNASANNYVKSGFNADGSLFLNGENFVEYGTFTPTLTVDSGTNPTYSTTTGYNGGEGYAIGQYYRIGDLVYINIMMSYQISNAGSGNAAIGGLPYASYGKSDHAISLRRVYNSMNIDSNQTHPTVYVYDASVRFRYPNGTSAYNWLVNSNAGGGLLAVSGIYRIA